MTDTPQDPEALARLDQFVRQQMEATKTVGLALALTDRAETWHVATYGYADLAAKQSVSPAMLFEIGSIGKSFTAIVLMQLAEAGQVDLYAPVTDYLPWFEVPSRFAPITVHHLLSHTGGISSGTDFVPSARYESYALRFTEAAYQPGEVYHYSNVGYKTLGYLIEAVLHQPYAAVLQERILTPLAMDATDAITTHATRRRLVTGYLPLYDDRPLAPDPLLIPAPWLEYSCADGSLAAPVADMARYLRLFLHQGKDAAGVLSPEGWARMTTPIAPMAEGRSYGYGLIIEEVDGQCLIGHGGGTIGYSSVMLGNEDDGMGIIIMVNSRCHVYTMARYALKLLHAAQHGLPLPELPTLNDATHVADAADYAGDYGGQLRLVAEDEALYLEHESGRIPLEKRGPHAFYVAHADFDRYLLRFHQRDGAIVAAYHGDRWYPAANVPAPVPPDVPATWTAYPGHYRSHNPWFSNFRVVLRQGVLVLILPEGSEQVLTPVDERRFQVEATPEFLRFDALIDGQAQRAVYSGADFYRQNAVE